GGAAGDSSGGIGTGADSFGGTASGFTTDDLTLYTNHVAPFVLGTVKMFGGKLTVTPQFRLQVMNFIGYQGTPDAFSRTFVSPEPRLALRYQLTPRIAIKAAAGLYAQPPSPEMFSKAFGNP